MDRIGRCIPQNSVTLLDVCDALADLMDLASYISTKNIRVLLEEDA